MNGGGDVQLIDEPTRTAIMEIIEHKASTGLRTIGLAYKNVFASSSVNCSDIVGSYNLFELCARLELWHTRLVRRSFDAQGSHAAWHRWNPRPAAE